MITVIMSTYKEDERLLRESIESILNQTYKDFEYIIILDYPDNDVHKRVIEEYALKDDRIHFYVNEKNMGLTYSLNRGLSLCHGEYIARMDADDISLPDRLERQMEYLEKNHYDLIGGITEMINENGSLLYYDGANLNAVMGYSNPAIMGFDVCHINLHKTFSTPHGGGGPGAGPIGVVEKLKDYLPKPTIEFDGEKYYRNYDKPDSIGKVRSFYGNFGVLVRAYAYILMMGKTLKNATEDAVLNANYLKEKLKDVYDLAYNEQCMHEFVLCGEKQKEQGASTLHIAKRLMDYEIHPPTVYFPLIVHEAIMIEPTESESKERLDKFVDVMLKIADEIKTNPELVVAAPHHAPIKKVDETLAARKPNLKYKKESNNG